MILTAHQPVYLPWLGLFHKIAISDSYCFFDIVQYQRKDYNNRNKIKTNNGPIWLSVPVKSSGRLNSKINDIEIINNGWNKKHIRSIEINYSKAKYFEKYIVGIKEILLNDYKYLSDLNYDILKHGLYALNIDTKVIKASDYNFYGAKSDLVLDMCKKLSADTYIFGKQGKDYADVDSFLERSITPIFQDYHHPVYAQLHGDFIPNMSFLDLIFNHGPDSYNILMSENITIT
jgi:hypothetical protein